MSTEVSTRKKKNLGDSTPAPDGDHRKRRRNRTTQSCLNCHTSKRMCDRKRPACARCTQLGLTGLCVYEVDDPSQRTDAQDESSRLLKRVAELEGVIRELKNKPHPRWVHSSSPAEELEKWQSRPPGAMEGAGPSNPPSPPASSSSSEKGDTLGAGSMHSSGGHGVPSIHLQIPSDPRRTHSTSPFSPGSPMNGSSPGLLTPTDEYFSPAGVVNHGQLQDYDLTSMFLNYPGAMGVHDGGFAHMPDSMCGKPAGHCGCIHDSTNYNNMLELSLRLRKAADVLSRSPTHQMGGFCPLQQRIAELDSFTTNVLSDISSNPGEHVQASMQGYQSSQMYPQRMSPPSLRGPIPNRPWDVMTPTSNSPTAMDDSFMTWEPQRRS